MKRTIIVLLFLIAATTAFAQKSDTFRLGMKLGPNLFFGSGSPDISGYEGSRLTLGFTGGGAAELLLLDNLSIEADLMFTWFNYGVNITAVPQGITFQYGSFEIPLLVKGRLKLGNGYGFLGVGPDFVILLGQVDVKVGNSSNPVSTNQIFHVGLMGTLGYDLTVGHDTNVTFEVRYLRTFSTPTETYDIQANRFDILFGWSKNF